MSGAEQRSIRPAATIVAPMPKTPSAAFGIVTVAITVLGWWSVPLFLRHFAE
jgi:hypothetical protein